MLNPAYLTDEHWGFLADLSVRTHIRRTTCSPTHGTPCARHDVRPPPTLRARFGSGTVTQQVFREGKYASRVLRS